MLKLEAYLQVRLRPQNMGKCGNVTEREDLLGNDPDESSHLGENSCSQGSTSWAYTPSSKLNACRNAFLRKAGCKPTFSTPACGLMAQDMFTVPSVGFSPAAGAQQVDKGFVDEVVGHPYQLLLWVVFLSTSIK